MRKSDHNLLNKLSRTLYEQDVEKTLLADTINTTSISINTDSANRKSNRTYKSASSDDSDDSDTSDIESDYSDTSDMSDMSDISDTSDVESGISIDTSDLMEIGFNIQPIQPNSINPMPYDYNYMRPGQILPYNFDPFSQYGQNHLTNLDQNSIDTFGAMRNVCRYAMNNPLFDILGYDVGCPFCTRTNNSDRIRLCAADQLYLDSVIRTHNGLQDLLQMMCEIAIRFFKMSDTMPVLHITMDEIQSSMANYDTFKNKLCSVKRNMFYTMDLTNSVYNALLKYLEHNASTLTTNDIKEMSNIQYNWDLFINNYLPLVATPDDVAYYTKAGTHKQRISTSCTVADTIMTGGTYTRLDEAKSIVRTVLNRISNFGDAYGLYEKNSPNEYLSANSNLIHDAQKKAEQAKQTGQNTNQSNLEIVHPTVNNTDTVLSSLNTLENSKGRSRTYRIEYPTQIVEPNTKEFRSNLQNYAPTIGPLRSYTETEAESGDPTGREDAVRSMENFIRDDYRGIQVKIVQDPYAKQVEHNADLAKQNIRTSFRNKAIGVYYSDAAKELYAGIQGDIDLLKSQTAVYLKIGQNLSRLRQDLDAAKKQNVKVSDLLKSYADILSREVVHKDALSGILKKKYTYGSKTIDLTIDELDGTSNAINKLEQLKYTTIRPTDIELLGLYNRYQQIMKSGVLEKISKYIDLISKSIDLPGLTPDEKNSIIDELERRVVLNTKPGQENLQPLEQTNELIVLDERAKHIISGMINKLSKAFDDVQLRDIEIPGSVKTKEILLTQYGGDPKLDILLPKLKDMQRDIYSTAIELENQKIEAQHIETNRSKFDELYNSIRSYVGLQIAVLDAVVKGELFLMKYIRPAILEHVKNRIRSISSNMIGKTKALKLIDRLEVELLKGEGSVIELSFEQGYETSVVPLIMLYYFIVLAVVPVQK